MSTRRRILGVLLLALTALVFLAGSIGNAEAARPTTGTPAVMPTIFECYDAPTPAAPNPGSRWVPGDAYKVSDGNAFGEPNYVPPQLKYGWNPHWTIYDNGCGPTGSILPKVGQAFGNLVGLGIPEVTESTAYAAMRNVVAPSWLSGWDSAISSATNSVADGIWGPYLSLALLLIACIVLWRAKSGALSSALTAVIWMMAVLTTVTWTVNYPNEAPRLVDSAVQTAASTITNSFTTEATPPEITKDNPAATAVDAAWGDVWKNTIYRTWLEGTFGSADSATAKKYGGYIYDTSHFTIDEWRQYEADPSGKGHDLAMAKKKRFDYWAKQVKENDPVAYDYLTGNNWGERMQTAVIGFAVSMGVAFFLAVAALAMLAAYLFIRLLVPFSPAAGVLFLFDALQDMAIDMVKKFGIVVVSGPILLVASFVVLRINSAVMAAPGIPSVLRFAIIIINAVVAWKIVRPASFLPKFSGGRMLRKAFGMAVSAAAASRGASIGAQRGIDDAIEDRVKPKPDHSPVDTGGGHNDRPALVPGRRIADTLDAGEMTATPLANGRGTFVPRTATEDVQLSAREAREQSAITSRPVRGELAAGQLQDENYRRQLPAGRGRDEDEQQSPAGYVADEDAASLDQQREDHLPLRSVPRLAQLPAGASGQGEGTDSPQHPEADVHEGSQYRTPQHAANDERHVLDPAQEARDEHSVLPEATDVGSVTVPMRPKLIESEDGTSTAGALDPSAVLVPATAENVHEVHESNVTFGEDGEPEFVIYRPEGNERYGVVTTE